MGKELSAEERNLAKEMMGRAREAMAEIEDWSQKDLDRLSQAIAWYAGNEKTFTRFSTLMKYYPFDSKAMYNKLSYKR